MNDRSPLIAALIREYRKADRDALLCAIISRWPDVTGAEIQRGINLAARPARDTRLGAAIEATRRPSL